MNPLIHATALGLCVAPSKRVKLVGTDRLREAECCALAGTNYRSIPLRPAGASPAA